MLHFERPERSKRRRIRFAAAASVLIAIGGLVVSARWHLAFAQRTNESNQTSRSGSIERGSTIVPRGLERDPLWIQTANGEAGTYGYQSPVVGDGALFSGRSYGVPTAVVATDERTGAIRWTSEVIGQPEAEANGIVYAVTGYRRFDVREIVALDSRTGRVRWRTPGTWVAIMRQLALVTNGTHVEARDAADGALFWSSVWDGTTPRSGELIGSTLYLQTSESGAYTHGVAYAYDVRTGRALWTTFASALIGVLTRDRVALDVTFAPHAYDTYAPLQVSVVSLATGDVESTLAYAPDRDRYDATVGGVARETSDVTATDSALSFRIGDDALYRYGLLADPNAAAPLRFDLRSALSLGDDRWLVRTEHGSSAFARFDGERVVTQPLAGLGAVESTFAVGRVALVVSGDEALVFDARSPSDVGRIHLPCRTVTQAFVADGALVAVCTQPQPRVVGIALPSGYAPDPVGTPIAVVSRLQPPRPPVVRAYDVPTHFSRLEGAAFASDGTLWFGEHAAMRPSPGTAQTTDRVAHLQSDGTIVEYPIPTDDAGIGAIARGPDGAMWFTESSALKLGRISSSGAITEFPLPGTLFEPPTFPGRGPSIAPLPIPLSPARAALRRRTYAKLGGLVAGSDGALWTTAPYGGALVRVTTNGEVRMIPLPASLKSPNAISEGPGGVLWFTSRNAIGRYDPRGDVRAYAVDAKLQLLTSIVWGPDGNIWFSYFDGRVGRITPGGEQRTFLAPVVSPPSGPLIGGCDGSLYMATPFGSQLWRVSTSGTFEEFDVPFPIGSIARSPQCTFGVVEAQAPNEAHAGTITFPQR